VRTLYWPLPSPAPPEAAEPLAPPEPPELLAPPDVPAPLDPPGAVVAPAPAVVPGAPPVAVAPLVVLARAVVSFGLVAGDVPVGLTETAPAVPDRLAVALVPNANGAGAWLKLSTRHRPPL
jgi:hypothetical protein